MFHKGPVAANGACQKWHILFLDIFQRNLAHGHENENNLKVSLKSPKKSRQNMCRNLKFLTAEKN
jgi:hypothetical protein